MRRCSDLAHSQCIQPRPETRYARPASIVDELLEPASSPPTGSRAFGTSDRSIIFLALLTFVWVREANELADPRHRPFARLHTVQERVPLRPHQAEQYRRFRRARLPCHAIAHERSVLRGATAVAAHARFPLACSLALRQRTPSPASRCAMTSRIA